MIDELRKELQTEYYEALKAGNIEYGRYASGVYENYLREEEAGEIILLSFCEKLHVRQNLHYSGHNGYFFGGRTKEQCIQFENYVTVKFLDADKIKTEEIFLCRISISNLGRDRVFKKVIHALTKRSTLKLTENFVAGDISLLKHDKGTGRFSFNLMKDGVDLGRFNFKRECYN